MSRIGSKWKLLIIRNLIKRPWRFNELMKLIDGLSQKVLTTNLRELESDGIVHRNGCQSNPPRVEYSLASLGMKLRGTLGQMALFGDYYQTQIRQERPAGAINERGFFWPRKKARRAIAHRAIRSNLVTQPGIEPGIQP